MDTVARRPVGEEIDALANAGQPGEKTSVGQGLNGTGASELSEELLVRHLGDLPNLSDLLNVGFPFTVYPNADCGVVLIQQPGELADGQPMLVFVGSKIVMAILSNFINHRGIILLGANGKL
jgi:hypothetical protein